MTKRAVILVPGFGKQEQLEARDRLVDAMTHYSDGYNTSTEEGAESGGLQSTVVRATARQGAQDASEIHVFEAYWGDLIPDWGQESPWARVKRGLALIRYWAWGGMVRAMARQELPRRTIVVMMIAAVLLLLWYFLALTVLAQALAGSEAGGSPEWVKSLVGFLGLTDEQIASWGALGSAPIVAFVVGFLGLGFIERIANVAAFTKAYLRDDIIGDGTIGLRAKARHRVLPVLDHVYDSDHGFDEVYVVAHSLGGAIAIDALAEYGDNLSRTTLFTWGSSIGVLVQQEPLIEQEIAKFYSADPRIRNWVDVVLPGDYMASTVPLPVLPDGTTVPRLFPETVVPALPKGLGLSGAARHDFYYRSEDAILMLLKPAEDLPQPVSVNDAG